MQNTYMKVFVFLFVFFIFCTLTVSAQPPTPPSAPIDGGLSLLLAGGIGYGIKKMGERRKK
jgi:hypothetical protein